MNPEQNTLSATPRIVVAIDGPSGSGKSTTAKGVARRYGLAYLDTGAMYRAVACAFLQAGIETTDIPRIIEVTRAAEIEISTDPDLERVVVNGIEVTQQIREPETSAKVSAVSTVPECRENLVQRQRDLIDGAPRGIVAEGRDITTVVAPDADVRILLTADPEVRVARRKIDVGDKASHADVVDQVLRRDRDDSKLVEFHKAADGVYTIDTTAMSIPVNIQAVCDVVAQVTGVKA